MRTPSKMRRFSQDKEYSDNVETAGVNLKDTFILSVPVSVDKTKKRIGERRCNHCENVPILSETELNFRNRCGHVMSSFDSFSF